MTTWFLFLLLLALAYPDDSDTYDLSVHGIGPAVYATDVGVLNMLAEKHRQTTEHTCGEIQDADWSGTVSGRLFEDCLYVDIVPPSTDWSAGGDSGSLVFSQTPIESGSSIKPVVGLHFAGGGTQDDPSPPRVRPRGYRWPSRNRHGRSRVARCRVRVGVSDGWRRRNDASKGQSAAQNASPRRLRPHGPGGDRGFNRRGPR